MARHSAHAQRRGIVHFSAEHVVVLIKLGRRDFWRPRLRRQVTRVRHLQGRKHVLLGVMFQVLARDLLHQRAQHDKSNVAVDQARARRRLCCLRKGHLVGSIFPQPWRLQIEVRRQSAVVRQQLPDRDVLFPVLRELRQILRDRIVKPHPAGLHQLHHRRGGRNDLG